MFLLTGSLLSVMVHAEEESATINHPSLRTFLCHAVVSPDAFTMDNGERSGKIKAENAIEAVKLAQVSTRFSLDEVTGRTVIEPLSCALIKAEEEK